MKFKLVPVMRLDNNIREMIEEYFNENMSEGLNCADWHNVVDWSISGENFDITVEECGKGCEIESGK